MKDDTKWQRYNQKLEKLMIANDLYGLATTYYEMADFIANSDIGIDPDIYRNLGYKMKLKANPNTQQGQIRDWQKIGVNEIEILSAPDSCDYCKQLNQKIVDIKDLENNSPIPAEMCTHKYGCRCVYLPIIPSAK